MENIYKEMWEEFKKKYGEEYIIFEGGNDVNEVMEEKYLKDDDIEEVGYNAFKIYIPFTKIRIL